MKRDVEIDTVLAAEIAAPGADTRHGVSLVAYPTDAVRAYLAAVQDTLRRVEPRQYFYPAEDLHLTVVEMLSDQTPDVAAAARAALAMAEPDVWRGLPAARLGAPALRTDRRAAFVVFERTDGLPALRAALEGRLRNARIPVLPRYKPTFAHVTLFRIIAAPDADEADWNGALADAARLPPPPDWTVDALWTVHGVTWYGRPGRLKREGPVALGPTGA